MLSTRLVRLIETHADELTRGLVSHLKTHPRTPSLHGYAEADLRGAHSLYLNLGEWLSGKNETEARKKYEELGRRRHAEGLPLSEILYALAVTKNHLLEFATTSSEGMSAIEGHGERELILMVSRFFDNAMYFTATGYEQAKSGQRAVA